MRSRTTRLVSVWLALLTLNAAPSLHADTPAPGGAHAATAATDGHETHKPNPFAGDLGNVVFTLGIFLILLTVLGKAAWKPLLQSQQQREDAIRGALEHAQRERRDAAELLKQYAAQLDRARQEATAIVDEGKRDAEAVRRRIHDEARREADEMIARARREIQLATDAAVKSVYDQAADLAVQVAGRIIHKELRPDDHRALVSESLERMKSSAN
ncbi:MAG: F0F1 ATP synthase subunit B [Phycisphaerae bacterium]